MKIISPSALLLILFFSSSQATTLDQLKYDPLFSLNHKPLLPKKAASSNV